MHNPTILEAAVEISEQMNIDDKVGFLADPQAWAEGLGGSHPDFDTVELLEKVRLQLAPSEYGTDKYIWIQWSLEEGSSEGDSWPLDTEAEVLRAEQAVYNAGLTSVRVYAGEGESGGVALHPGCVVHAFDHDTDCIK